MFDTLLLALGGNLPKFIAALQHVDSFLTNVVGHLDVAAKASAIDAATSMLQAGKTPAAPAVAPAPVAPVTTPPTT